MNRPLSSEPRCGVKETGNHEVTTELERMQGEVTLCITRARAANTLAYTYSFAILTLVLFLNLTSNGIIAVSTSFVFSYCLFDNNKIITSNNQKTGVNVVALLNRI